MPKARCARKRGAEPQKFLHARSATCRPRHWELGCVSQRQRCPHPPTRGVLGLLGVVRWYRGPESWVERFSCVKKRLQPKLHRSCGAGPEHSWHGRQLAIYGQSRNPFRILLFWRSMDCALHLGAIDYPQNVLDHLERPADSSNAQITEHWAGRNVTY